MPVLPEKSIKKRTFWTFQTFDQVEGLSNFWARSKLYRASNYKSNLWGRYTQRRKFFAIAQNLVLSSTIKLKASNFSKGDTTKAYIIVNIIKFLLSKDELKRLYGRWDMTILVEATWLKNIMFLCFDVRGILYFYFFNLFC